MSHVVAFPDAFKSLARCLPQKFNTDSGETGGLFGTVSAYSGTIQDQRRGTLHLHCLVWMASWSNVMERILKLAASAQTADVKVEMENLTERVKETFTHHISTNINLPPQDQALTRSCPNTGCDGTVQGPDKLRIGTLRRTDIVHNPADPKVIKICGCKRMTTQYSSTFSNTRSPSCSNHAIQWRMRL